MAISVYFFMCPGFSVTGCQRTRLFLHRYGVARDISAAKVVVQKIDYRIIGNKNVTPSSSL